MLGNASKESVAREAAHTAAKSLYAKLSLKLDALFNFHSAPKPFKSELAVKAPSVAAVRMEEATPIAMAEGATAAPEEVYASKRSDKALASRDELSQNERKAMRRQKKRVRKRRDSERDEQEKLRAKLAPGGAAAKRLEAKAAEKALADAKRKGLQVDLAKVTAANARQQQVCRELQLSTRVPQ